MALSTDRISVSSPFFSTEAFDAIGSRIAEHFRRWEVFGEGQQYLWDIERPLAEFAGSHGLALTAHAPISDVNIGSFNPRARELSVELVSRTVEAAGALGMPTVTVHPGLKMPISRHDEAGIRRLTLEAVRRFVEVAAEAGTKVCLENMPATYVATFLEPADFDEVYAWIGREADPANLGFCWDVAHANTTGTVDAFLDARPPLGNVHLSDNHGKDDAHLPLGEGNAPIEKALKGLAGLGYEGDLVIECRNLEEAVRSKGVLERLLSSLS